MIEIIDNLQLGSNIPLDARSIVNNIYDVSMYWFNGMQMFDTSTGRAWIVKDACIGRVEEFVVDYDALDGGSNWQTPEDTLNGGTWTIVEDWGTSSQIIEINE